MSWAELFEAEAHRARELFPSPDLLLTAFTEEAGELVKAVLDRYHLAGMATTGAEVPTREVRKEAIQVGAMLIRLLEEGDPVHRLPPVQR